ncbi:uncharacterized protein [Cherax quadricarinatus]|uniref:uncharacterized protein isoform X2 n=1 Tax=Cherax quadricarinatus TaxID=27406 RepID=UPI00387E2D96
MSSADPSNYVTVATFVVKDEGLESVSEDVISTEEITSVVDENNSESGSVEVSYIDAVETTVTGSDDLYVSAGQDDEVREPEEADGGGRSFTLWSLPAVRTLLDVYEEHEQTYVDKTMRRRAFWELISEKMKNQGHFYSWSACRIRFKGMCRKVLCLARHVPTDSVSFGTGNAPTICKGSIPPQGRVSKKKRTVELSEEPLINEAPDWFKKYVEGRELMWDKRMAVEEHHHNQVVELLSQNNELLRKLCNAVEKMDSLRSLVKIAPRPSPGCVPVPVSAQRVVCNSGTTVFVPYSNPESRQNSTTQS